ncbi:AMP-binding protein [Streptomyces sp. NPDC017979]|uniref:AMP-binding protein n=1 Tax=Streptomyces sp. NPDC017979 TaxID=3365024 RepID=UPI0037ACF781
MLAVDLVRLGAARFAGRTALTFGDRSLSYAEVDEAANRMAHVLAGLGAGRGGRVGLLFDNGLWSVPIDFACLKAGAARVPLNTRLAAAEHARMVRETRVDVLVYAPELAEHAHEVAAALPGLTPVSIGPSAAGDDLDLLAAMREASPADPRVRAEPDDVVLVLYTSGTTGTLKAARHTQRSYAAMVANVLTNAFSPGRDDVMLHAASLIHASGTFVLPIWLRGGVSAVLPGFDPDSYLTAIARQGITAVNLVPTMLSMVFAGGRAEGADLGRLHTVIYGASPMPRPLIERALDAWGPKFVQYYGQTEAPLCITALDKADHVEGGDLLGAAGHPAVDARVALTDDEGVPVGTGEIGEVRVKSAFTMAGYHQAPELTAQTLTPDGWIRTRDLGRFDDRGYLHLVDRSSDMIVTGGYNVYPREVEDVLAAHPAVAQCAVVGAPDPTWVEAVTAFVTLRPGATTAEEALRDHVRARLAGYKVPKAVHFVDAIPLSPVGKVLRRALRDPLWEGAR